MAPEYLSTLCQPVSSVSGRRHLRSARRGELDCPRVNLATYGGRAFACRYAGSTSWNSVSDSLKSINLTLQTFKRHLKTFLFLPEHDYVTFGSLLSQFRLSSVCNVGAPYLGG